MLECQYIYTQIQLHCCVFALQRIGNSGGLGGAFGFLWALGVPFPYPEGKPWAASWQQRVGGQAWGGGDWECMGTCTLTRNCPARIVEGVSDCAASLDALRTVNFAHSLDTRRASAQKRTGSVKQR
jgi:hypothetical protein